MFLSPQQKGLPSGITAPHINFNHEQKVRENQPIQEYFVTEQRRDRPSDKAVNFNNRYYCTGEPNRVPPMMNPVSPMNAMNQLAPSLRNFNL